MQGAKWFYIEKITVSLWYIIGGGWYVMVNKWGVKSVGQA
jgi:hypothetical protein